MEYNAENAGGFIKSWNNAYMQTMPHSNGAYPNEYARCCAGQFLEGQGEGGIDAITGASPSHGTLQMLAQAVLEQARRVDSSIAIVMRRPEVPADCSRMKAVRAVNMK